MGRDFSQHLGGHGGWCCHGRAFTGSKGMGFLDPKKKTTDPHGERGKKFLPHGMVVLFYGDVTGTGIYLGLSPFPVIVANEGL